MPARLKFRSVRTKLLAASLAMGLIPVGVVGVLAYQRASQSLTRDAGDALGQIAFQVADKIDRNYFERYGDVQAFTLAAARIRDWQQIGTLANEYMVVYGFYDLMVVADVQGRVVATNTVDATGKPLDTRFLRGEDVSGEEWFREGISGRVRSARRSPKTCIAIRGSPVSTGTTNTSPRGRHRSVTPMAA
jgi:methyl-accepting chemotaxis protein